MRDKAKDYTAFVERTIADLAGGAGLSYEQIAGRLTPLPEIVLTITNPATVPAPSFVGADLSTWPDQAGEYSAQNPPTATGKDGKA